MAACRYRLSVEFLLIRYGHNYRNYCSLNKILINSDITDIDNMNAMQ